MTFKRLIISIALLILVAFALYLLITYRLLLEPPQPDSGPSSTTVTAPTATVPAPGFMPPSGLKQPAEPVQKESEALTGSRLIEVFGRITDQDARPIEDVLITEEGYFFSTRSDADGHYRLLLDLPVHRYPRLNFLRGGYRGERMQLSAQQLQRQPWFELNLTLSNNPDAVTLPGWVSNDLGVGLEGVRIDLTTLHPNLESGYYLTVYSDPRGNFVLEGVPAGERYRLSANLSPEYPLYQNRDFLVSSNPGNLNIELRSLKLVDVDGMILNRQASPLPNFEIQINNVTTGTHSRHIVSDSSGFFSLRDFPPGEISLTTRGAEYHRITGLALTGNEYRNLVLTIDIGDHQLVGWILDESGVVPASAMVTLDRTDRDGEVEYQQYRSQTIGGDGQFSFNNLGSDEYRVMVYAQGYQVHERLHRFENQADEIRITLISSEN